MAKNLKVGKVKKAFIKALPTKIKKAKVKKVNIQKLMKKHGIKPKDYKLTKEKISPFYRGKEQKWKGWLSHN